MIGVCVFEGTVPNTVMQKLVLKDTYEIIDENIGDSNVGARKGQNIRSHVWMVNSVMHEHATTKSKPIEISIMDYRKAFDIMSLEVTTNDMFEAGIKDKNLNLMHACDSESKVSVKTPVGLTERVAVLKTIPQGGVNSSKKCTVTVSSVSNEHRENLEEGDHLYRYKNKVTIPMLGMVDDELAVNYCGLDSALSTAQLNARSNLKKLQYNEQKCVKMHVGTKKTLCCDSFIDTWKTIGSVKEPLSVHDFIDIEYLNIWVKS